jgi:hypothetical protein
MLAVHPPKDVVVVMPCPACHGLVVLFRDKVIALSRDILERGTRKQVVSHIADIIGEFLDAGVFPSFGKHSSDAHSDDTPEYEPETEVSFEPISKEEMDRFVKIELKCLDNPAYFKRHFG